MARHCPRADAQDADNRQVFGVLRQCRDGGAQPQREGQRDASHAVAAYGIARFAWPSNARTCRHESTRGYPAESREGDWTCPAPRLRSGRVMVIKETVRRLGIERRQSRIEAETRPAVRTEDRVRPAHLDVDVRVVLRWGHADALEFPYPDADFRDAAVVRELRMAAVGHRLRPSS